MLTDDLRGAAFRRLLRTGTACTATELANELNRPPEPVRTALDTLYAQGLVRYNTAGEIVGAAGLNVTPDRHEIELDGRPFWAWCAYDFFGIFAALNASGVARSVTPDTGTAVTVRFSQDRPEPADLVLFLPEDEAECSTNAYDQWCPNSNLFHSADAALSWAAERGLTGSRSPSSRRSSAAARAGDDSSRRGVTAGHACWDDDVMSESIHTALGGDAGVLRLADAWHHRCLQDPVAHHPFSHGVHPQHVERLGAYWSEALGGPRTYSETIGDHSSVLRIHAGCGDHEELDRCALACFTAALGDADVPDNPQLRSALTDWFAQMITAMAAYPRSADDVPDGVAFPIWAH